MRLFIVICCSLLAVIAANFAVAGPFEREMRYQPWIQAPGPRPEPPQRAAGTAPPRDLRSPGEADRGRMSPDERYQLRRDIQNVGKDIYHRDRQAPGRQQRR